MEPLVQSPLAKRMRRFRLVVLLLLVEAGPLAMRVDADVGSRGREAWKRSQSVKTSASK